MSNQPRLRPGTASDAAEVARIWHQGWRDGHLGSVPDQLLPERDEASFIERAPKRVADTTVLEVDGGVAGFIMILGDEADQVCLLYTSPSPRDATLSRMPSSA